MNDTRLWFSAGTAAEFVDVSPDTVHRRAIPWRELPMPGKIRFKLLKLGEGTRQERRYYKPDVEALLVA